MGLVNPLYILTIPSLVIVSIPLAILATLTTTIAFSILFLRALAVYIDIIVSFVPQSIIPSTPKSDQQQLQQQQQQRQRSRSFRLTQSPSPLLPSSPHSSTRSLRHHRRRRSSTSAASMPVRESGLPLIPSVGAERDFEGIGGWRRVAQREGNGNGDYYDEDDVAWTTVNPPLQLQLPRHHVRSASGPSGGGATTPGDGYLMMRSGRTRSPETRSMPSKRASPNSSRARTPTGPRLGQHDGYFAFSHSANGHVSSAASSPKATRQRARTPG